MSQFLLSQTASSLPFEGHLSINLDDVFRHIQTDATLTVRCRQDMMSASRTLGRVLGVSLATVSAQPNLLRERIAAACPQQRDVSQSRWNNVRSLTLKALSKVGIPTLPGRSSTELTPAWEHVSCLLTNAQQRYALSRFMRFCSARAIEPDQVETETVNAFYDALQSMSLGGKPSAIYRATCIAWNNAVKNLPGWPKRLLPVPSFSRRYALHWDDFPASFLTDSEAFLRNAGNQDPFADDYAKSVKPSTVAMRRKQILQIATALVRSEMTTLEVTGLAVLVRPENAQRALRFFWTRAGGAPTKYLHQQAVLIKTIAQHWVKAPAEDVAILRKFASNIAPKPTGMVEKNKAMLRQLDHPKNERRLLNLPATVYEQLDRRDRLLRHDALRAMYALGLELILAAPMRIDKLVGLELNRHVLITGGGSRRVIHIYVPATENKTSQPFEALLQYASSELLHRFLERYRPQLGATTSQYLFPNGVGQRRSTTAFGRGFSEFIYQETGLRMTRHIFRHLGVKFLLDDDPNDIETARLTLGHRSSATTERAYADRSARAALERLGQTVEKRRQRALTVTPIRQRTRGGELS